MCVSEIDLEVFWRPLCARRSTEKLPTSCNAPCFHQEKTFYCHQRFKANYFLCSVATIPSWRVLVFVLPLWVSFPVWLFAPPLKPLQVCSSHLSFPLFLSVFPCVSTFFHLLLRAEFVPLEDPPPTRVEIESPAPEFPRCFFRPPPPTPTDDLHTGCRIGSVHVWFGVCWGMINEITVLSCRDFRPHSKP